MTATLTAEKRRPSPTPPRPLRELPVLFHLMDVSRPKGYAAPPPPAFALGSLAEPELPLTASPRASELPCEPDLPAAESFDLETAAELVQTKAYGSLPTDSPIASPSLREHTTAATLDHSTDDRIPGSTLETPPPAADEAVNLRQRAEERQRKRQEGKKDDWFSTQGKFIVVGFIAALLVTIYVARSGRKKATPPVATKPHAHPGEAATVKQAVAVEAAKITSVRPATKTATGEPATALHPPTIPQLAQQPTASKSPADETLFTFSKRPEERVAVRPDAPTTTAPGPAAGSPTGVAPTMAPPPAAPPTLQPQYPSTSYPSTYQPVAPPPAYAPPPPAAAPGGPALNPAASTMPLYPTTNTASGNRYERTGSGLY